MPMPSTMADVLALATKSPPGVVQKLEGQNVCSHVASPVVASAPLPS